MINEHTLAKNLLTAHETLKALGAVSPIEEAALKFAIKIVRKRKI